MRTCRFVMAATAILSVSSGTLYGSWVKYTKYSKGKVEPERQSPTACDEGVFSRHWADSNSAGASLAAWSRKQKDSFESRRRTDIHASGFYIQHGYNWSEERNPPFTLFSCDWTEAFYVQNAGDCDNHLVFNGKGEAEAYAGLEFCFSGGPGGELASRYGVHVRTKAANQENKLSRNPSGEMKFGWEGDRLEGYWTDEPDRGKAWKAEAGGIISFSGGLDNCRDNLLYDNLWVRAYLSTGQISVRTLEQAAYACGGIFDEITGFDVEIDEIRGESAETESTYGPYESRKEPDEHQASTELKEAWMSTARSSGLGMETIDLVIRLLDEVLEPNECQKLDKGRLGGSLERYLKQFKHTFSGKYRLEACYWTAWLLAEAGKRAAVSGEDAEKARASFEALIEKAASVLESKAREAVGEANYPKVQQEVERNIGRATERLRGYFEELHDDVLFPAFKKPLGDKIEAEVLGRLREESTLDSLLKRQIRTTDEEEFYGKWLRFYFEHVPERVVFRVVVDTTKRNFRQHGYWGGMHHRANSCANGAWPIEMYLARIGR